MENRFFTTESAIVWKELPHCRLGWIAHRDITPHTDVAVAVAVFPIGGGHGEHRHPNAGEVIYVVSGEADQGVGDQTMAMKAGDSAIIPQDAVHWIRNTGDSELEILVVFNCHDPSTIELT